MSKIVGIDLGTTNSLIAIVDSGIPYVIADRDGQRLTPSVVHFSKPGAAPVVGHLANRVRAAQPEHTFYSTKRFIGRRGSDIAREELNVSYAVRAEGSGPVRLPLHGRDWSPEEIAAEVLKKLKEEAEESTGETISRAVITVPAYFNDAQRNATIRAGELAGLQVERIVNEPTAAALAYGLDKLKEESRIAVYDLGGGTFDLSILQMSKGMFQVLATSGNTRLGGDDLDRALTEFLMTEISRAGGPDLTRPDPSIKPMIARIREVAEQSKIRLSTESEIQVQLPFLTTEFSFEISLTRSVLEDLSRPIIEKTRTHCLRSLSDARLEAKDLNQIILVGGQTRMPLVRRMVSEWFGCTEFSETRGDLRLGDNFHRATGPQLNTSQNPDEAIAIGAAIQAEILSGGFKNLLLLDVTPLSLGLETFGGLMNVIIPRNTTIPTKAGELFTTTVDNQPNMRIHVLQGERERAKDNWSLGDFLLEFERAPKGVPRVGVQFEIDANGILHALARDVKTGHQKIVGMSSAVDVADEDVQRMVEESVEHAFDDLKARQWIEAKLRSGETLTATRKTMAEYDNDLDADYRKQLYAAMEVVETILSSEDSRTKTGDPVALRGANLQLDEVTKPLAEHAMDQVMEDMLRQRGGLGPKA